MSDERGEYRAVRRVLLDGPDFQRLPERARFVFLVLKLNFGAAGIDIVYPEALEIQVSAQTGASITDVRVALTALQGAGWIEREANVLWIVGQLDNDPHIKAADPKHRKGIVRHVSGLPRLDIVREYVKAHPAFFPKSDEASKPLAWAFQGPSKGHRSTSTNTSIEASPANADGTRIASSWPARFAALWCDEVGPINAGRVGAALKPAVDRHGDERVERAMRAYVAKQKLDGKPCKLSWFSEQSQLWVERTSAVLEVVDGEMNSALELATRPPKSA